jgi:hypothetical protein
VPIQDKDACSASRFCYSTARYLHNVGFILFLLGGCAGVPTAQLQAYSDAYDEARTAASLIYADAAPALLKAEPGDLQFPASLGPTSFDRDGCGPIVASIDSLRARCKAMIAVKAYNKALLDIAAGKTTDDILAQVDQAFRSVSTLAGLASGSAAAAVMGPAAAIFPALRGILGEALKARDRIALRDVLMQGAPHIRTMIDALRGDVDRLYVVQRAFAEVKLQDIKSSIDRNLTPALRTVANHSPPTDPAVASTLVLLEQRFDDMFSAPEPSTSQHLKGLKPAPAASARPLDGPGVASIESQLRVVAVNIAEFKAEAAKFNKSSEALKRYDGLLAALDRSLTELVAASSQIFAVGGGMDQLIQSIVTIRDHARDIKQLLAAR